MQVGIEARWRHDQVLRSLADTLEREQQKSKSTTRDRPTGIRFVRVGDTARTSSKRSSILDNGSLWQMKVDLMRKFTRLPRCDQNYTASRHSSVVCRRQKDHHHRANSAMGARLRRGPGTKKLKVLGTEGGIPGSLLENLVIPS